MNYAGGSSLSRGDTSRIIVQIRVHLILGSTVHILSTATNARTITIPAVPSAASTGLSVPSTRIVQAIPAATTETQESQGAMDRACGIPGGSSRLL
jgi:hypothetical protein